MGIENKGRTPEYGSDVIVDLLKELGIEYASLNPGATLTAIQDSLVNYGGNSSPELIQVCHEEIGVGIAHGYAKATGKPMVAFVHNVVGLLNSSMAIYNAWVDRVPVIVMGGTGPMDAAKRHYWIDWIHTALIQGNLIRDIVKWDDQPGSVASFPESLMRAFRTAMTQPQGPVYVCFDRPLQFERLTSKLEYLDVKRLSQISPIQGDITLMKKAAKMLVEASNPVILADKVGRTAESFHHLVSLAETLSIPVVDLGGRLNFPKTHPLDLTGSDVLQDADVVLALDIFDLHGALASSGADGPIAGARPKVRQDAKVIEISLKDLFTKSTITDFQQLQPVDVSIVADTSVAIPLLTTYCKEEISRMPNRSRLDQRFSELSSKHAALRKMWLEEAQKQASQKPISLAYLALELWNVIKNEDWILGAGLLGREKWETRLWSFDKPCQFIGHSGGGGLGYCLPASMGVALANRSKLVIDLQPDGDLLYVPSSIWTSAHHKLPIFVVVVNNRLYNNDYSQSVRLAEQRKRDVRGARIGNAIDEPPPNFAKISESYGGWGIGPIHDPSELRTSFEQALKAVKNEKRIALVDVVIK